MSTSAHASGSVNQEASATVTNSSVSVNYTNTMTAEAGASAGPTGIASKVNLIFDRKWTEPSVDHGSYIARKNLAAVRKTLELKPADIVYLFDDKPEWVTNTSANDYIVPVPGFIPAYELYGVAKTHNIVPNTIPHETTLVDIVRAQFT